jgi:hypothetical protein
MNRRDDEPARSRGRVDETGGFSNKDWWFYQRETGLSTLATKRAIFGR